MGSLSRIAYGSLSLMPRHAEISWVLRDLGETLRDPVASHDYEYLLGQLLSGLDSRPDAIPYEPPKGPPDVLKRVLLGWCNTFLKETHPSPPKSSLGGLVRFLLKKWLRLSLSCYSPVCLLDTGYKTLSTILPESAARSPEELAARRLAEQVSQAVLE